ARPRLGRPRAGVPKEGLLAIPQSSPPRLRRPKRHDDEGLANGWQYPPQRPEREPLKDLHCPSDGSGSATTSSSLGLRRQRMARDLLHDRHGALPDERDGHRVGAHTVASMQRAAWEALRNAEATR